MAKASETRPLLPKRRITSLRRSSVLRRVVESGFGEANGQSDFERHCGYIPRDDCTQNCRIDAPALGHIDYELGAGAAILGHDSDDRCCTVGGGWHVFAISAETGHFAEGEQRARVGIEHLAQIACIVVPGALELGDLPPQKPFDHCPTPFVDVAPRLADDQTIQAASTGGRKTVGRSTSN